jgi:hypothetical protein
LFYTKSAKGFKFYEIRAPHKRCRVCGSHLKDYGGKKDQMHPFGALVSDVWTDIHRIRHNTRRDEHPCQLPIHLLERIVLMSTDPGDLVLDPFLGTGTTAIAAKALGRHYIGLEIDPFYKQIAEAKLARVTPSLYRGGYVSYYLGNIQSIRDIDAKALFPPQLTATEKKRKANAVDPAAEFDSTSHPGLKKSRRPARMPSAETHPAFFEPRNPPPAAYTNGCADGQGLCDC